MKRQKNKAEYSALRLFMNCLKEMRQTKKDLKQLDTLELSMEALQRLVNTVAFSSNPVEIELHIQNGNTMIIRRETPAEQAGYKSFFDRYTEAKKERSIE